MRERLNGEIERRSRAARSFPSEASLARLVGAVCCEACGEWSSRRYMEPSGIEALWERSAASLPDPEAGQVDRARSRIIALAGLDWMEGAAQVRLELDSGPMGLLHFSRRYLFD